MPVVRQNYPWDTKGQAGWVRDMGALERIVEMDCSLFVMGQT
jgi:hypothetical protein